MNVLKTDKKLAVLNALLEGNSIRATSRITGVHKTTIMRLLIQAGEHCETVMNRTMRNLRCAAIEADEIWTFVGKKQGHLQNIELLDPELGDQYAFVAFDPDSKLVPLFLVGRRNRDTTYRFIDELRARVVGRIQLSTDGWKPYPGAVERSFGRDIDYALLEKTYSGSQDGRYAPPHLVGTTITPIMGAPDPSRICTSFVERNNLTVRMQIRRFTRLTNGFSRKLRNLKAAVALFFAHYNFCRIHGSLRITPAMAAGVSDRVWTLAELIAT